MVMAVPAWAVNGTHTLDPQIPMGRREDRVRLTLVAIAAPPRVSQCVCVLTTSKHMSTL